MTEIDKLFKDYNVTEMEQRRIRTILDEYRMRIRQGDDVNFSMYEADIIGAFGGSITASRRTPPIEYHFCEYVLRDYAKDGRWEEVFEELYGDFAKYNGMIEK